VENKGIDLSLAYTYTASKDLTIGFRGTFTFARNKVLVIDEPKYPYPTGLPWPSRQQLRGLIAERLFTDSADIAKSPRNMGLYTG